MSRLTPNVKVVDTEKLGAHVVLEGDNLDEAAAHAERLSRDEDLVFVHPFDDDLVIAGNGTVGLEMLEAVPELDVLVVPVGGGGLISGVATAAKALKPEVEILGVQTQTYPGAINALREAGSCTGGVTIAEGIAVKQPGERTLAIMRELVSDILLVSEKDVEEAIYLLLSIEKTVAEGAGAAALAALIAHPKRFLGKKVGVVLSGANVDSRILASVLMRHLARTGQLVTFKIQVNDTPGSLAEIATLVGGQGGNIIDVNHQRTFTQAGIREADISLTVESRDRSHAESIRDSLTAAGYPADFS